MSAAVDSEQGNRNGHHGAEPVVTAGVTGGRGLWRTGETPAAQAAPIRSVSGFCDGCGDCRDGRLGRRLRMGGLLIRRWFFRRVFPATG
ncbi:MAG: hypothetical protein KatS3mg110_0546 [Pirellulaceae bacterium]|nr:MAG: hypothetical protein KatS3mg110_0546 [Pirellulaceae bacterium]